MKKYSVLYDTSNGPYSEEVFATKVVYSEYYVKFYKGTDIVLTFTREAFISLSQIKEENKVEVIKGNFVKQSSGHSSSHKK